MSLHDDSDDDTGFVPPLPPEDRLWRHPSEVGAARTRPTGPAAPVPSHDLDARRLHPTAQVRRRVARAMALATIAVVVVGAGALAASRSFDPASPSASGPVVRGASSVVDLRSSDGARRVRPAVVQIRVQSASGPRSVTGLVIDSNGHVLTTSDALRDATSIDVIPVHGDSRRATVTGIDPMGDIAVLTTEPSGLSPAALVDIDDLGANPSIIVIGLSADLEPIWARTAQLVASHARVATPDGRTLDGMLQATVAGDPPDAALICTRDGAIIGIVTDRVATTPALRMVAPSPASSITSPTNTVYATPVSWMRAVVARLIARSTSPHP